MVEINIRPALVQDAADLARLDNVASHGFGDFYWRKRAAEEVGADPKSLAEKAMADPEYRSGWRQAIVAEADGKIDIHLTRDKSMAIIQVADNGPGIPQENAERIFERFYTDRPEGEAFGQNSGLGLSITRQIVEAHGGTITAGNVDPVKGGALFTVKIPLFASNGKNG